MRPCVLPEQEVQPVEADSAEDEAAHEEEEEAEEAAAKIACILSRSEILTGDVCCACIDLDRLDAIHGTTGGDRRSQPTSDLAQAADSGALVDTWASDAATVATTTTTGGWGDAAADAQDASTTAADPNETSIAAAPGAGGWDDTPAAAQVPAPDTQANTSSWDEPQKQQKPQKPVSTNASAKPRSAGKPGASAAATASTVTSTPVQSSAKTASNWATHLFKKTETVAVPISAAPPSVPSPKAAASSAEQSDTAKSVPIRQATPAIVPPTPTSVPVTSVAEAVEEEEEDEQVTTAQEAPASRQLEEPAVIDQNETIITETVATQAHVVTNDAAFKPQQPAAASQRSTGPRKLKQDQPVVMPSNAQLGSIGVHQHNAALGFNPLSGMPNDYTSAAPGIGGALGAAAAQAGKPPGGLMQPASAPAGLVGNSALTSGPAAGAYPYSGMQGVQPGFYQNYEDPSNVALGAGQIDYSKGAAYGIPLQQQQPQNFGGFGPSSIMGPAGKTNEYKPQVRSMSAFRLHAL
eukprot:jgi/Hompol1/1430/HPOL_002699-RA